MSYILDALRKADAERERGHVPSIHAQPTFAGAPQVAAARALRPWVWVAAGALVVALLAALLWAWRGGDATPPVVPPLATSPPAPAPVAAMPAPPPPAPVAAALPPVRTAPAPAPAPVAAARKPAAAVAAKPVVAKPVVPQPAASAASSASESRVYAVNELPEDIRRQLPAVNVGGSMYSATPANRILIINGQVLHEGEKIAPDLVLQQIKLKAAVLAFRGYRYSIAF